MDRCDNNIAQYVETRLILKKRISLCQNIRAKSFQTVTLFDALNAIRTNVYEKRIRNIRKLHAKGENKGLLAKKKQLPAYLFSGTLYDSRHKFDVSGYTSLLIIDIDHIDDIDALRNILTSDPHIVSIWKSPSGQGLKLLFYISYSPQYEKEDFWIVHEHCAFPQVSNYLSTRYRIKVDKTGTDITRLCFVSADPDIHLKREFLPFQASVSLTRDQIRKIRNKYLNGSMKVREYVRSIRSLTPIVESDSKPDDSGMSINAYFQQNYSCICTCINRTDYESADQLIRKLKERLDQVADENSVSERILLFQMRLAKLSDLNEYLQSVQQTCFKTNSLFTLPANNLPKNKRYAFCNLSFKIRLKQLVTRIAQKDFDSITEKDQIKAEIEEIISKGFRGGGCSSLRKWAKSEYNRIKHI